MTLEIASPEMQNKILKSINADNDSLTQGIDALKHWLDRQPHLPKMDKDMLKAILVIKKNSVENSKVYIDNYWSARHTCSEFYTNRSPLSQEIRNNITLVDICILPKLTPEGYRVTITRLHDNDAKDYSPITTMKRYFMIAEARAKSETYFAGDYVVTDFKGFSLAHLTRFTPTSITKIAYCFQEVQLTRLKGILVINGNSVMDTLLNMFRPFLKKKLAERIRIFKDGYENLYDIIPREMLPQDYGGSAGTLQELSNAWQKRIEDESHYLTTYSVQKPDESKRPKDSVRKENNGLFGMEGNFKKLTID